MRPDALAAIYLKRCTSKLALDPRLRDYSSRLWTLSLSPALARIVSQVYVHQIGWPTTLVVQE
jgi:hypothetical protein